MSRSTPITEQFKAGGIKCAGCESIIEACVKQQPGTLSVKADYLSEVVTVTFDSKLNTIEQIQNALTEHGYPCSALDSPVTRRTVWLKHSAKIVIGLLLIALILFIDSRLMSHSAMPELSANVGYWLILVTGLLTGFHCIGMCGGFVIGYTTKSAIRGSNVYLAHCWYGLVRRSLIRRSAQLLGCLEPSSLLLPICAGLRRLLLVFF